MTAYIVISLFKSPFAHTTCSISDQIKSHILQPQQVDKMLARSVTLKGGVHLVHARFDDFGNPNEFPSPHKCLHVHYEDAVIHTDFTCHSASGIPVKT